MKGVISIVLISLFSTVFAEQTQPLERHVMPKAGPVVAPGQIWVVHQQFSENRMDWLELQVQEGLPTVKQNGDLSFHADQGAHIDISKNSVVFADFDLVLKGISNPIRLCVGEWNGQIVRGVAVAMNASDLAKELLDMQESYWNDYRQFKGYLESKNLPHGTCTAQLKS